LFSTSREALANMIERRIEIIPYKAMATGQSNIIGIAAMMHMIPSAKKKTKI
jgi:hypothetical protein